MLVKLSALKQILQVVTYVSYTKMIFTYMNKYEQMHSFDYRKMPISVFFWMKTNILNE